MNSKKLFIYHLIMLFIPATKLFKFKAVLLRWCEAKVGSNVRIVSSEKFYLSGELSIGDNTRMGHEVMIVSEQAPVIIRRDCNIAHRVMLVTGSHKINDSNSYKIAGDGYSLPREIGNGCWIFVNVTIVGGSKKGDKVLIGANNLIKSYLKSESKIYSPNLNKYYSV